MADALPDLSPAELARYRRHLALPGVGLEGQRRLAASRVLVVGLGGLGSPAALYLAAAGVGRLGLADLDAVEEHNLQRQILYDGSAVGQPKVEAAARRLAALNPHVRLQLHGAVTRANAVELFSGYDLIVDGTDRFPSRYLINDAAFFARRPLVHGSVFRFEGQVAVFDPARGGPCYRCLFPVPPPDGSVPDCSEAGVLGALCGAIGSLQALEAVKYLLGLDPAMPGRLLIVDGLTFQFRALRLQRDPACPLCGNQPRLGRQDVGLDLAGATPDCAPSSPPFPGTPLEITVEEARRQLESTSGRPTLLDVREDYEVQICRVASSVHIPLREVPHRLGELPRDQPLLVLCHHGARSRHVTEFLRAHGFPAATNVQGGIAAWAEHIDPSMARY